MRHSPAAYAKAFVDTLQGAPESKQKELLQNFLALIKKNGDWGKVQKVAERVEKELHKAKGTRSVLIETAREVPHLTREIKSFLKERDSVTMAVNPSLIAGMRVTVNDELQFDGTLEKKLQRLFHIND